MKRPDAIERLMALIEARRRQPYAWGAHDCVLFAADAIEAMTGEDPLGALRGTWANEEEARSVLATVGGLIQAADARFQRRDKSFIQRGDLCLVEIPEPSYAICTGTHCAAPGELELLHAPLKLVRLAWSII